MRSLFGFRWLIYTVFISQAALFRIFRHILNCPFTFSGMKFRLLLLFLVLTQTAPASAALVYGNFRNAYAGNRVSIIVPHYYIDGKKEVYAKDLNVAQEFSFEIKLAEPQLVFLEFNYDRLALFLAPDDTLSIKIDAFKFPLVAGFSEKGGANNALLHTYLRENGQDYDEFNNYRFKIGQWWASVEAPMRQVMENLEPQAFRDSLDRRKRSANALLQTFDSDNPGALSPVFKTWLSAEILYYWAYHLLVYGHVFGNMHRVQPDFFEFLYDAPILCPMIGSEWYRQFLLAVMARQQDKTGSVLNFWSGQYERSGTLLEGKPLAFFRSEMINIAFSGEQYREILPLFNDFLKSNTVPGYDEKVADLYEKFAKISPGAHAPVFSGTDPDGRVVSLEQFRGKVVYLNFWASWCGACIRKMEYLNPFVQSFKARGIEIVNISVDQDPGQWKEALSARAFAGYNMLASSGNPVNIAHAYNVEAIPQYFIIDASGSFADKAYGHDPEAIRSRLLELAH